MNGGTNMDNTNKNMGLNDDMNGGSNVNNNQNSVGENNNGQ